MLNQTPPDPPIYQFDESRTVTDPDGSTTTPSNIAFYPNRHHPNFKEMQGMILSGYGRVSVYELDARGRQMGLVTAPGINPRAALDDVRQYYLSQGNNEMAGAITDAMRRFNPSPALRP